MVIMESNRSPSYQILREASITCFLRSLSITFITLVFWNFISLFRYNKLHCLISIFSPSPWFGLLIFSCSIQLFLIIKIIIMEPNYSPFSLGEILIEFSNVVQKKQNWGYAKLPKLLGYILFLFLSSIIGLIGYSSSTWFLLKPPKTALHENFLKSSMLFGFIYGLQHIWRKKFVLRFPLFQRKFRVLVKHCILDAALPSLYASIVFSFCTLILHLRRESFFMALKIAFDSFINISFFMFVLEMNSQVFEITFTERRIFNLKDSKNDIKLLHSFLEVSEPHPLSLYLQYLSAMEICHLSTSNNATYKHLVFKESDEYARLITICCGIINENMINVSTLFEKKDEIHPTDFERGYQKAFQNMKLCEWCARIASSLSIQSIEEDMEEVGQQTHANTLVISTLLSSLLHLEKALPFQLVKTNFLKSKLQSFPFLLRLIGQYFALDVEQYYEDATVLNDVFKTQLFFLIDSLKKAGGFEEEKFSNEEVWYVAKLFKFGNREVRKKKLSSVLNFDEN